MSKWKYGAYRLFLHKLAQELHKSVEEVLDLPASELLGWENYFSIYPFTQDREDYRMARIIEMINLSTQNMGYRNKNFLYFMPDYLVEPKSEEQKLDEERRFVQMAIAAGFAKMEGAE